jgi:hypothetical protein
MTQNSPVERVVMMVEAVSRTSPATRSPYAITL